MISAARKILVLWKWFCDCGRRQRKMITEGGLSFHIWWVLCYRFLTVNETGYFKVNRIWHSLFQVGQRSSDESNFIFSLTFKRWTWKRVSLLLFFSRNSYRAYCSEETHGGRVRGKNFGLQGRAEPSPLIWPLTLWTFTPKGHVLQSKYILFFVLSDQPFSFDSPLFDYLFWVWCTKSLWTDKSPLSPTGLY